jgi:hypothetical protein
LYLPDPDLTFSRSTINLCNFLYLFFKVVPLVFDYILISCENLENVLKV